MASVGVGFALGLFVRYQGGKARLAKYIVKTTMRHDGDNHVSTERLFRVNP